MGVNSILLKNILLAAPLITPQLHIDHVVLADSQLLQVTAFVPGGDTLQLGISPLCGDDGDDCLCYVNGLELTNDREMAVDDAAIIHCWGLPVEDPEEAELVTIENSTSQHSLAQRK